MDGTLKRLLLAGCVLAWTGCAPETETEMGAETDTAMAGAEADTAMAGTGALAVEDVTGTWAVTAYSDAGDSLVSYTVSATGDPSTWTVTFPGDNVAPVTDVRVTGDSLAMDIGPYSSALREGVQVTTHTMATVAGDRMSGRFVARYQTTEADSVLRGTFEGRRQPGGS